MNLTNKKTHETNQRSFIWRERFHEEIREENEYTRVNLNPEEENTKR